MVDRIVAAKGYDSDFGIVCAARETSTRAIRYFKERGDGTDVGGGWC